MAPLSRGSGEDEIPLTAVEEALTLVTCIAATGGDRLPRPRVGWEHSAFAALLSDGHVVTWGSRLFGGCSDSAQGHLCNVTAIQALRLDSGGFVALCGDGTVVPWGIPFEI